MKHLQVFTDGGARGNPGPAAIGIVIQQKFPTSPPKADQPLAGNLQSPTSIVWEHGEYIGEATNNQAEYRALIRALEEARKMRATHVDCFLDSELIVRQLMRQYRVKDAELGRLFVRAWNFCQGFQKVTFHHIPRSRNARADRLVNQALDNR